MSDVPRLDQAAELVLDIRAALDAAGLDKVHATVNAAEVPSGAPNGVVVVAAPKLDFASWGEPAVEWELHAIAGPADNYLAAWSVLDRILQALHAAALNLKRAEPGGYAQLNGPVLPSYTITLNDPE
jgi:hypothetical protein